MKATTLLLACAAALSGCSTAPTTAARPDRFYTVHAGTYDAGKQALFVDCVFDGFLGSQNVVLASHVRQVKRANGYRIDVIEAALQYVVADIRDDGEYQLTRLSSAVFISMDKEEVASLACLEKFGKVTMKSPVR